MAERDTVREVEYRAELPSLQSWQFSTLSSREKAQAHLYSDQVSFTPDGQGGFTVVYREPAETPVFRAQPEDKPQDSGGG